MHRVATESGHLDHEHPQHEIEQTPAEVVFLSAADTDLAAVAQTWLPLLGERLRLLHAAPLQHPETAQKYVRQVVASARIVVMRLLGGDGYFPHLLDELRHLRSHGAQTRCLLIPSTDQWDAGVLPDNDFAEEVVRQCFEYFREGGLFNVEQVGRIALRELGDAQQSPAELQPMPRFGWYGDSVSNAPQADNVVWICFYRAWYQTGDVAVVDSLREALTRRGLQVRCCYAYSLRDPDAQAQLLQAAKLEPPQVVLTTQSFSVCLQEASQRSFLEKLDCPVLQIPVSLRDEHTWEHNPRGLSPSEVAMNVALPEMDGRVLGTLVGFKEDAQRLSNAQWTLKRLQPALPQIEFVAELVGNWRNLRRKTNGEKRIALILANYPNRDSRLGNGVGLDTPESVVRFLAVLGQEGYQLPETLPANGDALIERLQAGITNDPEGNYGKYLDHWLAREQFDQFIRSLPSTLQEQLSAYWPQALPEHFPIAGFCLGNVFIGIQPARGFEVQTQAIYHSPELPPPPHYLAFYHWLRAEFKADAVIHFGKHGNLEWLPGRSVGLGPEDYPWHCLGPLPHLYPFIVNNPGEGTQAKRRTSAVIVDHLTPPLARAGLYDELQQVERLLEEHAHCETMNPERAHELEHQIEHLLEEATWRDELPPDEDWFNALSNFLCDIKESQIRSGLHIFGEVPQGELRTDFLLSLLRMATPQGRGLLHCLADRPAEFDLGALPIEQRDALHQRAREWIAAAAQPEATDEENAELQALHIQLRDVLLPRLEACAQETTQLLRGLAGRFVEPGPAGAPTRGRYDVLPTGRNFYAVDPRTIPTPTSWKCGQQIAERLLERYRDDHGDDLRHLALVIWGTSNMRTGGDDIAQALWLWGCEPVWERTSGRLVDFEILPLSVLRRPRVDVLLRVSGLFRDAFGETMRLLATVPKRLAELDEPAEQNPIRATWLQEQERLREQGVASERAQQLAHLRVFSAGPGCYGSGLLPLIDAGNWESKEDLTQVFLKWGGHGYAADGSSVEDEDVLRQRLGEIEVVHQNQDNREHDILDSDDYFQFHGGLHAAVEQIRGQAPATYHGDSSNPDQIKVRTLREEFNRVFRSRVLNPHWLEAMRRHGYKGAFEMAATVDYFFGYDATTNVASEAQYSDLANKLLLDETQQQFFKKHNPLALRDATQRILEAHERGMWENADPELLAQLQHNLLELQGNLE